ncbi:MAG TPA: hypothetical protein VMD99_14725 [Terriglobales bacterium]|nr:hypothetical protein [Terriglobales bacterium]
MRAFTVHLNSKKLCVAGVGDDGVLTAIVNYVARQGASDMFLQVGGLHSSTGEHVRWIEQRPLRAGDEIRVRIVDVASVDAPKKKRRTNPAETLKAQKRYVREMAKKLGWKIQTRESKAP